MKKNIIKAVICIIALSGVALTLCESFAGPLTLGFAGWIYGKLIPEQEAV